MRWFRFFRWIFATDFCPWANRFVYWLKHPVACLVLAAGVSLIFAILLKPIAWGVFGGLSLILGLGLVWPWMVVRSVDAEVRFSAERVTEGEPARLTVIVKNRCPWPVWGLSLENLFPIEWRDASLPNGQERDVVSQISLARVPGRSTSRFHWTLIPSQRGVYPKETPSLATGFPFGLWTCRRPLAVANSLIVWPKTFAIETLLDAPEATPAEERFSDYLAGDLGDMSGTRPFRDGDSLRRVHWAQTARYDRLVVSERHTSVVSHVELIAELAPENHSPAGRESSLEWTIRILASLAKAWHAERALVTCRWGERSLVVSSGSRGIRQLMDALAEVSRDGPPTEVCPSSPAGLQVLITTDRGLARQTIQQKHTNHRSILLSAAGFAGEETPNSAFEPAQPNYHVYLRNPEELAARFRTQWRGLCHVG